MQKHGNRYGTHRVIEPVGVLPQPANKLDNNMDEIYDNEILIDVQTLNIDSASFTDIHNYAKSQAKDPNNEAEVMEEIKSISVNHRLPEIGLMQIGFKPGTLSSIEEELYYLEEKNENQYSSLLGYEKLMASGKITPKQKIQYKQTKASFERDEKRIRELRMKLKRLTIIGLGNL